MPEVLFYFQGLILGFSIAAPVGPIGVLCIRTSLAEGRNKGFIAGLGAATADALYGMIAGLGLTAFAQFLVSQEHWVRFTGGLFLAYLGLRTMCKETKIEILTPVNTGYLRTYFTTLFLTLTNPLTILSFTTIFAGLGVLNRGINILSSGLLVFGVFSGSAFWWFILSWVASRLGTRIDQKAFVWINRVAGVILLGFAIFAIYSLV